MKNVIILREKCLDKHINSIHSRLKYKYNVMEIWIDSRKSAFCFKQYTIKYNLMKFVASKNYNVDLLRYEQNIPSIANAWEQTINGTNWCYQ